ncbi:ABC1 family protein [Cryptosporidium muris RN66]|uniref:ABC1 family protein n=1 Tax=Cryptosporidium muris (strain RN66) TaxID=441375 RepID=B6AC21_CRYMR|nr:ABC1 family protein [Cryptosporidium muris RN66]EEA05374.1 ABC1 family protein [Cryptosporidium muris RN66]|eukprot:XP_002139723.1 ABC1 family protein [Cryptosporidium muris RN66]
MFRKVTKFVDTGSFGYLLKRSRHHCTIFYIFCHIHELLAYTLIPELYTGVKWILHKHESPDYTKNSHNNYSAINYIDKKMQSAGKLEHNRSIKSYINNGEVISTGSLIINDYIGISETDNSSSVDEDLRVLHNTDKLKHEDLELIKHDTELNEPITIPTLGISRFYHVGNMALRVLGGTLRNTYKDYMNGKGISLRNNIMCEENAIIIGQTLRRLRGAALKFGQILSLHNHYIPKVLSENLSLTHNKAYEMPIKQLYSILENELGPDWKEHYFEYFSEIPFAAASIGQVHYGRLNPTFLMTDTFGISEGHKINLEVAIKVQYPNIEGCIRSDLNSLLLLSNYTSIFPKGLYIKDLIKELQLELIAECDYKNEALFMEIYKNLLIPSLNVFNKHEDFYVPRVYKQLSTAKVLVTEYFNPKECAPLYDYFVHDNEIQNTSNDKIRNKIAESLLYLTLQEFLMFNIMQTDPNPANFLYDSKRNRLILLDFGATRSYSKEFVYNYWKLIQYAVEGDIDSVKSQSIQLGFLTGYEQDDMIKAHTLAVMKVAEPFVDTKSNGIANAYDFSTCNVIDYVAQTFPKVISSRENPPRPEIYSLHRRLAGCFVLCNKLAAKVNASEIYRRVVEEFRKSLRIS